MTNHYKGEYNGKIFEKMAKARMGVGMVVVSVYKRSH